MSRILLVEDDTDLCDMIADWLTAERHQVEVSSNGGDGIERLRSSVYDMIILDWELPDASGVDIVKDFRSRGGLTPILMLTGKKLITDKEQGFKAGADDYLTKPFHMKELALRIMALLRRPSTMSSDIVTMGTLSLDINKRLVSRNGNTLELWPREYNLLEFLITHQNEYYSTDALLIRLWPSDANASPDTLRQCVKRLRAKVEYEGQPPFIRNTHGLGYKLSME